MTHLYPFSYNSFTHHLGVTIIGNPHHRAVTGAVITERDLQTLERCNRENIKSLEVCVYPMVIVCLLVFSFNNSHVHFSYALYRELSVLIAMEMRYMML